jgi:hypothetical protein
MISWQDAYDIKFEDGTFNVYKKDTTDMVAYCRSEENAVEIAQHYFNIIQDITDDFLLGSSDE